MYQMCTHQIRCIRYTYNTNFLHAIDSTILQMSNTFYFDVCYFISYIDVLSSSLTLFNNSD